MIARKQDSNQRIKVAFLSYGWPEYCLRLVDALSHEASVCLLAPRPWASQLHQVDKSVSFQPFDKPRYRQPLRQLQAIFRILGAIKRFNPDVIHIQHGHLWFNLVLPLLRRYPLVFTIHDPRHHVGDKSSQKTPQRLLDFGFGRATELIVHTSQMAEMVVKELAIPGESVHIVPHIQLGDDRALPAIEENENQILFFGRIWEYKGLEYLIKAEPLVTAQIPQVQIIIAGQGEDFARYQQMMVHPEQFIIHNEFVSNEKRTMLFRQASVVVLPYIEATQSGVIPIAYTFKKPVVATAVGGLPEQVDEGCTGFLVPPKDEKALAEKIVYLLHNKDLRHQLGANGKHKLETEWASYTVAHKTLQVYQKAIRDSDQVHTG